MRFSIVIPNYNSEKWIRNLLSSILEQTYKDYEVIIIDDMSTDNSVRIIKDYLAMNMKDNSHLFKLVKKRWNGGTRNVGVEKAKGDYIVFADCDDWFNSDDCLEEIARVIEKNNEPDCVRLPYRFIYGRYHQNMMLSEKTPEELVKSIFVAPWTKCVKRELFVPFPENTLIEDIVQHIAQVDNIETVAVCEKPIILWNKNNADAISARGHKYNVESKRYSSIYRNIADLLDLRCKHSYCEEHRQWRIKNYLDIIHNSREDELVERG